MEPLLEALTVIGINVAAAALGVAAIAAWRWFLTQRNEQAYATVFALVEAAEQMFDHLSGEQRLSWVMNEAERLVPQLDGELVRALIEAAVFEMNEGRE